MRREKPEFVLISLACEVNGYANAELNEGLAPAQSETRPANVEK